MKRTYAYFQREKNQIRLEEVDQETGKKVEVFIKNLEEAKAVLRAVSMFIDGCPPD